MRRVRAQAGTVSHGVGAAGGGDRTSHATTTGGEKGRMVHIRLDSELHRKLRLVVAAEDTTLQEWITLTLKDAADKAWAKVTQGARR